MALLKNPWFIEGMWDIFLVVQGNKQFFDKRVPDSSLTDLLWCTFCVENFRQYFILRTKDQFIL